MGEREESKKKVEQISVEATVENIAKVTDFVNEQLERYDCPMKAQMQIDIAIVFILEQLVAVTEAEFFPDTGMCTGCNADQPDLEDIHFSVLQYDCFFSGGINLK